MKVGDKLPQTLKEAVLLISDSIDPEDREKTKVLTQEMDIEKMATTVHHTLGRFFRNELKLWEHEGQNLRLSIWESLTPLKKKHYDEYWKGVHVGASMHADDASHELLVATLRYIKEN